ncbi:hypothetical protein NMY3_02594 [Candidatus Nitrosocosmicus oleophilus]|uniref:Uncharacterized protein n=1 Tax=Candidatus Nitrosocosmicus oleophilus TaxID=1353260 RepID=A0A654M009_9ARCH|nr:hypothetical protein NMY3_02594 [Candidatus Nitrosocosmicus oleophilus]
MRQIEFGLTHVFIQNGNTISLDEISICIPFPKAFCPRVGLPLLELDHFLR